MKILSAEESRALDAETIRAGTPGLVLMRRAAAAVAREILVVASRCPDRAARVVVLAGVGNNGGDGFAVARLLVGAPLVGSVETLLVGDSFRVAGDAATTLKELREASGSLREVRGVEDLEPLRSATLVVDALFGTGLSRVIEEKSLAGRAIALLNETASRSFVVSIDVPSGSFAGSFRLDGPHVRADLTVTFGYPKSVHAGLPAASACGRVVVAPIGFVEADEPGARPDVEAIAAPDVARLFPPRAAGSHKGTYGHLGIFGGSAGMEGASALAALGAHRGGAGLVTVCAPEAARRVVNLSSPESLTAPLEADVERFTALAVGPGLGRLPESKLVFERAIRSGKPALFDADALNLAEGASELFLTRSGPTLLTPHPGEAARLLGSSSAEINADRLLSARTLVERTGATVILKGFRSIVAAPGRTAIVLAGNPGMANGGMGDLLTGLAGALLARGFAPWDAAIAAAWLHGTAGDLAREESSEESLTATDLARFLPFAFRQARRSTG